MKTKKGFIFFLTSKLLLFLTVVLFLSCEKSGLITSNKLIMVINNETSYRIKITAFSRNIDIDSFEIKSKKCIERKYKESEHKYLQGIIYLGDYVNNGYNIDSIIIDFDDKKRITQYCDKKPLLGCRAVDKNLAFMNIPENSIKSKDGNLLFGPVNKYQITFTEEDYEKAIPL